MFCPQCRDEFRQGFSRCERCNVDLVEDLSRIEQPRRAEPGVPAILRLAEYCGFLSLDDAREAREKLREQRIRGDIVIRDAPDSSRDEPAGEEYWLRVDASRLREVPGILGEIPKIEEPDEPEGGFACGDCGQLVANDANVCPKCGARFD